MVNVTDVEKLPAPTLDPASLEAELAGRNVRVVSYDAWRAIDAAEVARGTPKGKVRDKLTSVEALLAAAGGTSQS